MAPPSRRHRLLFFLAVAAAATISAALLAAPVAADENNSSMTDVEALMQLKKSFTNSSSLSSWLITDGEGSKSPCAAGSHHWHGVVCSRGVVTGLRLSGLELGGTIAVDSLSAFPRLRSISFAGNNFSGALPAFHQLTALKSMFLSDNGFSGSIPDDFFANLAHLKKLWLDGNRLSGPIPASISQATSLLELHLDRNALTGELPPLPPPALASLNVSDNDLEGVVPEPYRRFNATRFDGNEYLCFVPTRVKPCKRTQPEASSARRAVMVLASLLLAAAVLVLALRLCSCCLPGRVLEEDDDDDEPRPPEYVAVSKQQPTTPQKRSSSWLGRRKAAADGGHGHRRAASAAKVDDLSAKSVGDLVMVNDSKGVFGLTDLMKAAAEVIGTGSGTGAGAGGGLGASYKAVMASGVAVVVKRSRDMNRATRETFESELKKLGALRHANLLPPLAYHYRRDEKLLVYEYIPKGSLLYVLHGDRGVDYAALAEWPTRLRVALGVARGAAFLHAAALLAGHEAPHGNLKSANVLLAPDFEPLLVDFGFSGLISHMQSPHALFAYRAPECAAGHPVSALADVYCLGVVLLELLTGKFPSQYLQNAKGGTDLVVWAASACAEGYEQDLLDPAMMAAWKFALPDMTRLMRVAVDCVQTDLEKRPEMKEAAARVEEVAAAALANVRERRQDESGGGEGSAPAASRGSHASYVREGSMQRITSVGERSLRRGSNDPSYGYGIS